MALGFLRNRSIKTRLSIFTLLIFLLSLWSLAFYASNMLHQDMEQLLSTQQRSEVNVLARDVEREVQHRLQALDLLSRDLTPDTLAEPKALKKLLAEPSSAQLLFNGGLIVYRKDGTAAADTLKKAERMALIYADVNGVAEVLDKGVARVGRPTQVNKLGSSVFGMTQALRNAQGEIIGAVSGLTELGPANFLDFITHNRYGTSGSTLLVARQHRLIITASDERRVMETLPAVGVIPVIDRAINGAEGSFILVNPLGVEVLAAIQQVPSAGWYVATQMSTAEAFQPITNMQLRMLYATLALSAIALVLMRWTLTRELSPMLDAIETIAHRAHSDDAAQPLPVQRNDEIGTLISSFNTLTHTLSQRTSLLLQVLNTSSVGIFLVDRRGFITLANERMAKMFGYPLKSLVGMEYVDLIHPSERDKGRTGMLALLASEVPSVEADRRYWHQDQTEFWGHLSGQRLVTKEGELLGLVGVIADITERMEFNAQLHASAARYRTMIEWSPEPLGVHRGGRIVYVNPAAVRLFGASSADELVGHPILERVHPNSRPLAIARATTVAESGKPLPMVEEQYLRMDGSTVEVETQATRIEFDGKPSNLVSLRDISERKKAQRRLQLAALVFSHAREAIMITSAAGEIIEVNEAFTRITGYPRDEVLGRNPRLLNSGRQGKDYYASMWKTLAAQGHWIGEVWNRRKSGEVYAEMQTISTVFDANGQPELYVALFSDITAAKEHSQHMERIAHFDALTNLPNRVLLADRLQQAMAQAQRRGLQTGVAFLDLDGFKSINDHHGHDAGDALLVALALRMRQALREGDTLARMGGDEFVAVLVDLPDAAACLPMLTRLLDAAAQAVPLGDVALQVSASLGVTFFPQTGDVNADQLLRQADQAMYQAKQSGKNRYHIFDAEQDRSVRGHHESLDRIREALLHGEFVLHYQPKVNMRSGEILGAEALIRWQHPERGLLAPADFLPVIEDHPLAVEVGEWVLETALCQLETWKTAGHKVCISVNVGAGQLQHADFLQGLRDKLAAHPDIDPLQLELEVLETSALDDVASVSCIMEACRDMGIMFALDDFGTGYSSLTYLKLLPAASLKIDQSFVRDMLDDADDLAILDGVIGMARAFHRSVIAEGVETTAHGTLLLQLGCDLAQGYGIARPMPADAFLPWMAQWTQDPAWSNVQHKR